MYLPAFPLGSGDTLTENLSLLIDADSSLNVVRHKLLLSNLIIALQSDYN